LAAHKKGAKLNGATVIFVDETGFSQRPSLRRTYAPRGQTPVVKEHFNWKRLSAIGAIAWRPQEASTRLFLTVRLGSISSPDVVEFLRNLRRHIRGPVVVIWDGLTCHRSGETQRYIDTQKHWLTVARFPAYAPELNPLEALWSTLKGKDVANYSPDSMAELDGHLRRSIRRVRRRDVGLNFIKHAGLISGKEHKHLCKGQ
jgi:transposase